MLQNVQRLCKIEKKCEISVMFSDGNRVGEEVDRILFQHLSGSTEVNHSKLGQTERHFENSGLIPWNPKMKLFLNIALQPLQAVRQWIPVSFF
jgi:hypothetical protein